MAYNETVILRRPSLHLRSIVKTLGAACTAGRYRRCCFRWHLSSGSVPCDGRGHAPGKRLQALQVEARPHTERKTKAAGWEQSAAGYCGDVDVGHPSYCPSFESSRLKCNVCDSSMYKAQTRLEERCKLRWEALPWDRSRGRGNNTLKRSQL